MGGTTRIVLWIYIFVRVFNLHLAGLPGKSSLQRQDRTLPSLPSPELNYLNKACFVLRVFMPTCGRVASSFQ